MSPLLDIDHGFVIFFSNINILSIHTKGMYKKTTMQSSALEIGIANDRVFTAECLSSLHVLA